MIPRSRPHPFRLLLALLGAPLLACGGDGGGSPGPTGPIGAPPLAVSAIHPEHFASGDTVVVEGTGLASAAVFIDGVAVATLDRSDTRLRFVAPASLPPCGSPLPTVSLVVSAATGTDVSRPVAVRGTPRPLPLVVGGHRVLSAEAGGDCPVRLPAGTYGVAVYTVAPASFGGTLRTDRQAYSVVVRPAGSDAPAAAGAPAPRAAAALFPRPADWEAASARPDVAPDAAACVRAAAQLGSVVRVQNHSRTAIFATEPVSDYRVVSASAHFAVLMRDAELAALSPDDQRRAAAAAQPLEEEVYAFLAENLGPLPDYDGDGRLSVLVSELPGLNGLAPPYAWYADGCRGDFVWIDPQLIPTMEAPYFGWQAVVAHEATHWIDFAADGFAGKPDWSIEGFATLMQQLWLERKHGIAFWAEHDDGSSCGNHCTYIRLLDQHYGPIGDGYINGTTILRYLVQEAVPPGTPYAGATHALLRRGVNSPRIQPLFELLGGRGRAEAELQGELLLMLYADGYVAGTSPRLQHHTFDLPKLPRSPADVQADRYPYPMRSFFLDAGVPSRTAIPLAVPDGIVFELVVPPSGASLDVTGPAPAASLAIVRTR